MSTVLDRLLLNAAPGKDSLSVECVLETVQAISASINMYITLPSNNLVPEFPLISAITCKFQRKEALIQILGIMLY